MNSTDKVFLTENLKNNFSEILVTKNHYLQINFRDYLRIKFNVINRFIDNSEINEKLRDKFKAEYNDVKKTYFSRYGTRNFIEFDKLYFYQEFVGIEGPRHNDINNPVFVVKNAGYYILWDGYHRVLFKIFKGEFNIDCFILEI